MKRSYDRLEYSLLNAYGNRKKQGRLSLFIDIDKDNIYPVPREIEHIDYADELNIIAPSRLIPVHIDTELINGLEHVVGVLTGVSGLEIKGGVRHLAQDLEKAHELAWKFIKAGEVPVGEVSENKINYKYAEKANS